jgi:hypothetical protein
MTSLVEADHRCELTQIYQEVSPDRTLPIKLQVTEPTGGDQQARATPMNGVCNAHAVRRVAEVDPLKRLGFGGHRHSDIITPPRKEVDCRSIEPVSAITHERPLMALQVKTQAKVPIGGLNVRTVGETNYQVHVEAVGACSIRSRPRNRRGPIAIRPPIDTRAPFVTTRRGSARSGSRQS